jgi:hypothetical protein
VNLEQLEKQAAPAKPAPAKTPAAKTTKPSTKAKK